MRTSHRRLDSGLSMLEVMIAVAILGFIMFATYTILLSTSTTAARGQINTNLDAAGKTFIEFCKKEFYDARFVDNANTGGWYGIHDNNTAIHYQIALGMSDQGNVVWGYPAGTNVVVDTGVAITLKGGSQTVKTKDYSAWADYTAVLRFEPELVYYEGTTVPTVLQPGTDDARGPQTWQPNPYAGNVPLAQGTPLPVYQPAVGLHLKLNINRDYDQLDVFVKGKIWKYVMKPDYTVHSFVMVSDNVFLPVVGGIFKGNMIDDPLVPPIGPTPIYSTLGAPVSDGKDWLFRYLQAEQSDPPTTYGSLDTTALAGTLPTLRSACIGITVWHGALDDTGKFFHLRKTWERIPFRLNRVTGP
jgi:prepilin-type N-terminal cleavage/methylation domain-containing protein